MQLVFQEASMPLVKLVTMNWMHLTSPQPKTREARLGQTFTVKRLRCQLRQASAHLSKPKDSAEPHHLVQKEYRRTLPKKKVFTFEMNKNDPLNHS